jgi:ribosomal protein S18 acetylase RimI-like enzyme
MCPRGAQSVDSKLVEVEVRPLVEEDVDAAREVLAAAWYSVYPLEGPHGTYVRDEVLGVRARMKEAEVLGAFVNGQVCGCVTLVLDPSSRLADSVGEEDAGLRMLGVAPWAQGRGVGGALVRACQDRARAAGRRVLVLFTDADRMQAAQRLYAREGFVRAPARDRTYPDIVLWCYVRELEGA